MNNEWVSCDKYMPFGDKEIWCLVTFQEMDLFDNKWRENQIGIFSYSTEDKRWNTKSIIRVNAWMYLPLPYGGMNNEL